MKTIKWRKGEHGRYATIEGVKVRHTEKDATAWLDAMTGRICGVRLYAARKEEIDAAAYALADLVQTLKGME